MNAYRVHPPSRPRIPILLSVPHSGTMFPEELKGEFNAALIANPDDTDWCVDQLYDFASSMGITMITSIYSRWVIDLNRDPLNIPLYSDGRIITGLCPVTTFLGEPLYADARTIVDDVETNRRLTQYYWPYHHKLAELLSDIKAEFGKVLLWDCHSIRQYVKTVYHEKIPDLILGDADGASASPVLSEVAYYSLKSSSYSIGHNFPFKGGYITRAYGKPLERQHALQLEMTKINYMDDLEIKYAPERAEKMRLLLSKTLDALTESVGNIS